VLYNITYGDRWAGPLQSGFLGASLLHRPSVEAFDGNRSMVVLHILWVSNEPGAITNGSMTNDGKLHFATCMHTIDVVPIPSQNQDSIQPTTLFLSSEARNGTDPACAGGTHDGLCMALIIGNLFTDLFFHVEGPDELHRGHLETG